MAKQWLAPAGRDVPKFGCIVSLQNRDGKTLSLHRTGINALEAALDDALSLDPTFRVCSISTPQSIYTDLQGRLPHARNGEVILSEHRALGKLRRMKMLHPSIQPRSDEAARVARGRGDMWDPS